MNSELTWLQKHERLIIFFFCLLTIGWLGNKYLDLSAAKKDAQLQAAVNQVTQVKQQYDQLTKQSSTDINKYQQMLDLLQKQNVSLIATIQSEGNALKVQQSKDEVLPITDLVSRWNDLIGSKGVTDSAESVSVTPEAAHITVSQLESVPVMKDQIEKGTIVVQNGEALLNQAQSVNNDLTKQLSSATLLQASKDKECADKVSAVKADARKSKGNWFLRGAVVGGTIVAYIALHI